MNVQDCPNEVPPPAIDYTNFDLGRVIANQATHTADLIEHYKGLGFRGANTGRTISLPVADGYAVYMMVEGPTSFLVHMPYGDAYRYPDIKFLPKGEILKRMAEKERVKRLYDDLFRLRLSSLREDPDPSPFKRLSDKHGWTSNGISMIGGDAGHRRMRELITSLRHLRTQCRTGMTATIRAYSDGSAPHVELMIDGTMINATWLGPEGLSILVATNEIVATFAPRLKRTRQGTIADCNIPICNPGSAVLRAADRRKGESELQGLLTHLVVGTCGTETIDLVERTITSRRGPARDDDAETIDEKTPK